MKNYLRKFNELPNHLFATMFWNILFAFIPLCFLYGIFGYFEIVHVKLNGETTNGFRALLVSTSMAPFLALGFSIVFWIYLKIGNLILRGINKLL